MHELYIMDIKYPELKLIDSFIKADEGSGIQNSISKNGDKIFITYFTTAFIQSIAGELFINNCGKLENSKLVLGDSSFSKLNGGKANNKFDKFTVLDSSNGIARIKLLDSNLNVIRTKTFNDYFFNGNSFNGGVFSDDGIYIGITYIYDGNIGQNFQKSVLRILRSDNLLEVATYKYDGYTDINGFRFLNNNYIIINSVFGVYSDINKNSSPPSYLSVLKINSNNIKLIDQTELPEICKFDIYKNIIFVGTDRVSHNLSNYVEDNQSFINFDNDEYRVYKFKNNKLKLLAKKSFDNAVMPNIYSDGQFITIQQASQYNGEGYFEISKLQYQSCNKCQDDYIPKKYESSLSKPSLPKYILNFSENGKWAIITGATTIINKYNNIQLYQIY